MKKQRLIAELVALALLIVLLSAYPAQAQPPDAGVELPKVALIGDSIRLGYAPLVTKRLAGRARVIVERLKRETSASVVFASTTPILDDRHAKRGIEALDELSISLEPGDYMAFYEPWDSGDYDT